MSEPMKIDDDNEPAPVTKTPVKRGPRGPYKPRTPARSAATRDPVREPAREPVRAEARVRKRKGGITDPFYVPTEIIPDGMSWEWKRHTVIGMEERDHLIALRENGWEPVQAKGHPELPSDGGVVIHKGMILMERPKHLTLEARNEDYDAARHQMRAKEEQLGHAPPGTATRDHPQTRPRIGRSIEPLEVPRD